MADGFSHQQTEAFIGIDSDVRERFYSQVAWTSRRLNVGVTGLHNVPEGPAIFVANHAFGWDVAFAMAAIRAHSSRNVWALGEHLWWKIPFLRSLAVAVGVVDGTPENADRLLSRGELVVVLPGGLREAMKPRELRYRLLWGTRYGFVRAAIRNRAPLVPLVAIGSDELFDFVGNPYARGRRWLHRNLPLPLPARLLPIPHRVHLQYVVGEPIPPACDANPDDATTLRRLRREVEGGIHEIVEQELARRAGIRLD